MKYKIETPNLSTNEPSKYWGKLTNLAVFGCIEKTKMVLKFKFLLSSSKITN